MKLMDEVKLQSSVDALEALCSAACQVEWLPAIRQNLQAIREVLRAPSEPAIPHDPTPTP